MVNVAPIPDWLENAIGEAKNQDILHRFLAKVVIDAIDLLFAKDPGHLAIQFSGRNQVMPERLLDNDTRPAFAVAIQAGCAKLLNNLRILAGRRRKIKNAISAGPPRLIQFVQLLREPGVALGIIKI